MPKKLTCYNALATNPRLTKQFLASNKNTLPPDKVHLHSNKKFYWVGECGHEWDASPNDRSPNKRRCGRDCPFCSGRRVGYGNSLLEKYPYITSIWDYFKNNITPDQLTHGTQIKAWLICPKCNISEFLSIKSRIGIDRSGYCSSCTNNKRYTNEDFIRKAKTIWSDTYLYNKIDYFNAHTKVIITCRKHGDFPCKPNNHLCGKGCDTCNESTGERLIRLYCEEYKLSYERQYKFKYLYLSSVRCKLRYDFAIFKNGKIYLIEYDGEQHFKPNKVWGGKEEFEKILVRDAAKNKYAKENGYPLLRISYLQKKEIVHLIENFLI